jgi:hypothetical protein
MHLSVFCDVQTNRRVCPETVFARNLSVFVTDWWKVFLLGDNTGKVGKKSKR